MAYRQNRKLSCLFHKKSYGSEMRTLMSWLGMADIHACGPGKGLSGPIGLALAAEHYDEIVLLADQREKAADAYCDWLVENGIVRPRVKNIALSSPTNFREIYFVAKQALQDFNDEGGDTGDLTIHLSPGTPAMQAVWIILARTRTTARLIQASREAGVEEPDIPFDIAAEFIPEIVSEADKLRREQSEERPPIAASFGNIIYRSCEMDRVVRDAKKAALRNLPVLIEGESGTGKELFARAIHNSSPRRGGPFQVVNCGAIPSELVESEFFGHKKGAFTGATEDRIGAFDAADGGTLFLDEIGELPLAAQVTLLRTLQEGEVKPVGGKSPHKVDVRVIAATNRILLNEITKNKFREDLYYRLAVATLDLPPLRTREGDIGLLAEEILKQVNESARDEPGYTHKILSSSAKNRIISHSWPGNVRELLNTIRRATLFADGNEITAEDMARAIRSIPISAPQDVDLLNHDLGEGVNLEEKLAIVARHYLTRAMTLTSQNKTKAAKLLGFNNPQTLSNWLDKYQANVFRK